MQNRQAFLTMAACAAAAGVAPAAGLAQSPAPAGGGKIDVHHHIVPPLWIAAFRDRGHIADVLSGSPSIQQWTPSASIEQMDRYGIRTAITSISTPGVWLGDAPSTRPLARACNEYAAANARAHPGRFGFFAVLPLPDLEGSLAEAAYALDVLKADGIGILTDYGEKWPGDASFAPLFDELHRRNAVVFVHPTLANCCVNLIPGIGPSTEEYLFNTTRAITSLLVSGTFTRCSNVRFIFTHAGGTMPMVADRVVRNLANRADLNALYPNGAMHDLLRQYYDVTTSTSTPTLDALFKYAPGANIVFGSDYPYVPVDVTVGGLGKAQLDPVTLAAIERGNAARLFPRLTA